MTPRVKICCISSIAEARTAIDLGASALGLVGRMPSGPGPIPDALIREIAHSLPPPVGTFLLTSETSVDGIRRHHQLADANAIQIVDALSGGTYAQLNVALPSIKIIQVIHVLGRKSIDEAVEISEQVDALLLDSGNPNLRIKELGGTGRVHDWRISREIRDQARCPVFLAGGLTPDNVAEAIDLVEPFGVDACSGVRTDGRLDERKVQKFIHNALQGM